MCMRYIIKYISLPPPLSGEKNKENRQKMMSATYIPPKHPVFHFSHSEERKSLQTSFLNKIPAH